jgi:hypothetical protein
MKDIDYKSLAANIALAQNILSALCLFNGRSIVTGRRCGRIGCTAALIILLMIMGGGFLVAGLYLYLSTMYPLYTVCLILSGLSFSCVVAFVGMRAAFLYCVQRRIKRVSANIYKDIKDILSDVEKHIEEPLEQNPLLFAGIALVAGFFLGKKLLDR